MGSIYMGETFVLRGAPEDTNMHAVGQWADYAELEAQ